MHGWTIVLHVSDGQLVVALIHRGLRLNQSRYRLKQRGLRVGTPCAPLRVTIKNKLDLSRRRHTFAWLQRQGECLIQNIADCFLGRDEPPKDSKSHDDVDRFDAIPIKIRDAVCL